MKSKNYMIQILTFKIWLSMLQLKLIKFLPIEAKMSKPLMQDNNDTWYVVASYSPPLFNF